MSGGYDVAQATLSLAELIKRHRASAKLSQEDLAKRGAISVRTVSDIETGPGYVNVFSSSGTRLQPITANTSQPLAIAVDKFQDLYVGTPLGTLAVDDATGSSLYTDIASGDFDSVTIGGPTVVAFSANSLTGGNGSTALRSGTLQYTSTAYSALPTGSACVIDRCWYDDNSTNQIFYGYNGSVSAILTSYAPGGMAYDAVHNRLFVADAFNNAIHVYNGTTLAFEKTIT